MPKVRIKKEQIVRIRLPAVLAAATAAALLPAAPAPAGAGPQWTDVSAVPRPAGALSVQLHDISAISSTDVWTVGVWTDTSTHPYAAIHNGIAWTAVPVPDPAKAGAQYELNGVDGTGPGDVWAVGDLRSTAPGSKASTSTNLVMHFDGQAWSVVASPAQQGAGVSSTLTDIAMVSASDGWAVGQATSATKPAQAFILRWSAGQWVGVTGPASTATSTTLNSVHANAGNDVWAVGSQVRADGKRASLVLHWDGTAWQQVKVPDAGTVDETEELFGIATVKSGEVWAVGRICTPASGICRPLALHLQGGVWQVVPTAGDGGTELRAVIAYSSTDAWILGYATTAGVPESDHAEHWDGTRFTTDPTLPVPAPGGLGEIGSALVSASVAPDTGTIWATGWLRDATTGDPQAIRR